MLGAITGDIVGSPYEFDGNAIKTTDFELFGGGATWTDDTVMTVAVAEVLLNRPTSLDIAKGALVESMRRWGTAVSLPKGGYGDRFSQWLRQEDPTPYGSYGNGSAMRVSAAGWLYPTMEETERWAETTAVVTHNHPEGIKGAQATAAAIFLARTGAAKPQIKDYVQRRFGYDLSRTLDEIRPGYHHVESCQETVPEAITAFLESSSFEDAIRKAVSLGGDSDTLAAITGSIAEGFYGIPDTLRERTRSWLDPRLAKVVKQFEAETLPQRIVAVMAPIYPFLCSRPKTPTSPSGWPDYAPEMRELMHRFSDGGIADHHYPTTVRTAGLTRDNHHTLIRNADAALLASILTWNIRGERFSDGLWAHALENGTFAAIAHRAFELAGLHHS